MPQTYAPEKGILEAADRILGALIRDPKFKEVFSLLLGNIDPRNAPRVVRTLFWEDPAVFMSALGAVPSLANALLEALAEALRQFDSFPDDMLLQFLNELVQGMDGARLGEVLMETASFISRLRSPKAASLKESASRLLAEAGEEYRERTGEDETELLLSLAEGFISSAAEKAKDKDSPTGRFIEGIGEAIGKNKDFNDYVLRPLLAGVIKGK